MDRTGWLIYTREDAEKNTWFIEKLKSECLKYGITLKLVYSDDLQNEGSDAASLVDIMYKNCGIPSLAVNRSRLSSVSYELESRGVRVFNPASVTKTGNDKELSYKLAASLNIPYMPYLTVNDDGYGDIGNTARDFGYPLVLKPADGHGGKHVFLINDEPELMSSVSDIINDPSHKPGGKLILQRPCTLTGRDLRVYIVGNRIIAGMLRSSGPDNDFRANFSLGGTAALHTLTDTERLLTEKMIDALPSDFIGIDFIYDKDGNPIFNEIEDAVGSRMLYKETDIDIISLFADHIHHTTG